MSGGRRAIAAACTVAVGLVAAVVTSCGSGGGSALHAGPRRIMLRDVVEIVIVPTYERLTTEALDLRAAGTQLDSSPDAAALSAAQAAWRRTRAAWKQSAAFAIGPAVTLRSEAKIDWTPIRADHIESEIAGSTELTAASVEDLGSPSKGFLALEYLLFDPTGDDAVTVQQLAENARRRRYVRALAENLYDQTAALRDAWTAGFAAALSEPGSGNTVYPTVKSAVDALVNQLIFLSEDVADAQLLAALGTKTGGVPHPEVLAAHRSRNSLADLLDNLAGIQNLYFGAYDGRQGASLSRIVADIDPATENALTVAIARALDSASHIPQSLEQALEQNEAAVEVAQVRAKQLMRSLEIDLVTVLGSTLRFNPNDGD